MDIEEMKNLAAEMPEKATEMKSLLFDRLKTMDASLPFLNPYADVEIENKEAVCVVTGDGREGNEVWVNYEEKGNKRDQGLLAIYLKWWRAIRRMVPK